MHTCGCMIVILLGAKEATISDLMSVSFSKRSSIRSWVDAIDLVLALIGLSLKVAPVRGCWHSVGILALCLLLILVQSLHIATRSRCWRILPQVTSKMLLAKSHWLHSPVVILSCSILLLISFRISILTWYSSTGLILYGIK